MVDLSELSVEDLVSVDGFAQSSFGSIVHAMTQDAQRQVILEQDGNHTLLQSSRIFLSESQTGAVLNLTNYDLQRAPHIPNITPGASLAIWDELDIRTYKIRKVVRAGDALSEGSYLSIEMELTDYPAPRAGSYTPETVTRSVRKPKEAVLKDEDLDLSQEMGE